jgi:hypothetical protein
MTETSAASAIEWLRSSGRNLGPALAAAVGVALRQIAWVG